MHLGVARCHTSKLNNGTAPRCSHSNVTWIVLLLKKAHIWNEGRAKKNFKLWHNQLSTCLRFSAPLIGSSRFSLCLMNGIALLFLYLLRTNISLTMVCMVRKPATRAPHSGWSINDTTTRSSYENESATSSYDTTDYTYVHNDVTTHNTWSNTTRKQTQYAASWFCIVYCIVDSESQNAKTSLKWYSKV